MVAAAQAPLDLQIYGRVNVSYESIKTDQTNWEMVDNSSRIGFRGKKALGGGLNGIFQIESRAKVDDGSKGNPSGGVLASRDSYVGLQHDGFGTGRFGRTIGPVYYATYDYISLHNHDTGTSSDALLAPAVFGNMGFMDNTIWYTSPKFGGAFTVDAAFSRLAEVRTAGLDKQPSYLGLVGAFNRGPIYVAISHAQTKDTVDLGGGRGNDDQASTIGGLIDLKTFVIGALFERATSDLAGGGDVSRNYWRVSAMMPVGKHEFHLNYGMVDHRLDADINDDGAAQWTIAYNYNLTKEFKLYTFYTMVDNEQNGNYGFRTSTPGLDNKSFAVGARYNF
jgi:predicted porin